MKKKAKYITLSIIFGTIFIGTFAFLVIKSRPGKENIVTTKIEKRTIEQKIMASGSIIPRTEVEVKSSLSGVVNEIFVKAGDIINEGTPILSVRVIPNSLDLNSSETAYQKSLIQMDKALSEMNRTKTLFKNKSVSESEYQLSVTNYELAEQDYLEASNRIMLLKEGRSKTGTEINNIVYAPITGTVLSLPLKSGASIQENGGMSIGTTIAYMADMDTLYFEGSVDEAQIGNLYEGLSAHITIAALEDIDISGSLSFISPRGVDSSGAVLFPIEIDFSIDNIDGLRAGYSASAEIVLKNANNVVSILERDVKMENGICFVEVLNSNEIASKEITLGVSDGIYTEVLTGLKEGDEIIIQ